MLYALNLITNGALSRSTNALAPSSKAPTACSAAAKTIKQAEVQRQLMTDPVDSAIDHIGEHAIGGAPPAITEIFGTLVTRHTKFS